MIGLGTMGRNFVLNMVDHGFSVAGHDKDPEKVATLIREANTDMVFGAAETSGFLAALKRPRTILLLVPAGKIVDAVITELTPQLDEGDLIVDCGNSYYADTDRRSEQLEAAGLHFMGIGVSGGESGARYGPSIMPGGAKAVYGRIGPMLEAVSAKVNGEPCVTWLGHRSAGNYVKMVHNGIEYGLIQLIAEAYHLLKEAGGFDNDELHNLFAQWNRGPMKSFLLEITADIFAQADDLSANRLIDMIRASAKQKGTGMWTSQEAMSLHVPIPTIDMAVASRDLSALVDERTIAQTLYPQIQESGTANKQAFAGHLEHALHFATLITYTQGMALLRQASTSYNYELHLAEVARIWRGGCIIRAALLEEIRGAFTRQPTLPNLLLDKGFALQLTPLLAGARHAVKSAVDTGIPASALMASLAYYDA